VTIEIVARQFCHVIVLTAALETVALESQHGRPQCFAPFYATDTWDNEGPPPREVIGSLFMNRANLPGGTIELSVTDGCQRPGGDRSSMPTRQRGPLVNIAHS
jgi:hypothetical protein